MTPETKKKIQDYTSKSVYFYSEEQEMHVIWFRECLDEIERLQKTLGKIKRVPIAPGNLAMIIGMAETALTESQERGDE